MRADRTAARVALRDDGLSDPRAFRWVESGVSGLARAKEWDATALVEAADAEGDQLEFRAFPGRLVDLRDGFEAIASRAAKALDDLLERPYEALAVRRDETTWAVAARVLSAELVRLPALADFEAIELAHGPDGTRTIRVDGGETGPTVPQSLAAALAELERRGRARFQAFAATADRVEDDLWEVRVDPL